MDTTEKAKTLRKLVNTDLYKNSKYTLLEIDNNLYGLKLKRIDKFLDLKSEDIHHWDIREHYFKDCTTNSEQLILDKFYKVYPIIKEWVAKEFGTTPTLSNVDLYKQKLMEDL